MTVVARNDGYSAQQGDGTVREAIFVSAPNGLAITPGTTATSLGKAEDAPHTDGDVGVMALGVRNDAAAAFTSTALDYSPIAVNGSGDVYIATRSLAASLGKAEDAPHTSGDVGVASLGVRNDANVTLTSANLDYATLSVSESGQQITKDFSASGGDWSYVAAAAGISNTTTAVTIKAAAGASIRNYITGLQISADALGAATELAIRDGAAGAVIWRTKVNTAGILSPISIYFASPIKGTANTLLEVVTLTASITGSVYVNAQGYVGP